MANGGNAAEAMRDLGYSPKYARNPQKITKSKSWIEIRNKYVPLSKIAKVHDSLLQAERPVVCDKEISLYPDNDARARAVDMGYKLHGSYAPEKVEDVTPYAGLSNAELLLKERELTLRLAKRIKK